MAVEMDAIGGEVSIILKDKAFPLHTYNLPYEVAEAMLKLNPDEHGRESTPDSTQFIYHRDPTGSRLELQIAHNCNTPKLIIAFEDLQNIVEEHN